MIPGRCPGLVCLAPSEQKPTLLLTALFCNHGIEFDERKPEGDAARCFRFARTSDGNRCGAFSLTREGDGAQGW